MENRSYFSKAGPLDAIDAIEAKLIGEGYVRVHGGWQELEPRRYLRLDLDSRPGVSVGGVPVGVMLWRE
ncbi:MAG: hypothetical protein ACJ8G2_07885 [Burkholderiales bacterium]